MPTAPHTLCRAPSCAQYATKSGYCEAHQGERKNTGRIYDRFTRANTPELQAAAKLRSSGAWKKLERLHKDLNPHCCDPLKRHDPIFPPMTQASHHIVPLAEDISRGLDYDNLAPLCHACHNAVEGMERRGDDAKGLFKGWKNVGITMGF